MFEAETVPSRCPTHGRGGQKATESPRISTGLGFLQAGATE